MCFEKPGPAEETCDPLCLGWTFDWMGLVHPCGRCRRLTSDAEAAAAFRAFERRFAVAARGEHQCSETCRGWDLFDREGSELPGHDIEACDACSLFSDDDAALDAAIAWIHERLAEIARVGESDAGGGPC